MEKPIHETYLESFSSVQLYKSLTFRAHFIKFHGLKTASEFLAKMHVSLYKQFMVIKQKNLQQLYGRFHVYEAMQTSLFNCVLCNVRNKSCHEFDWFCFKSHNFGPIYHKSVKVLVKCSFNICAKRISSIYCNLFYWKIFVHVFNIHCFCDPKTFLTVNFCRFMVKNHMHLIVKLE